MAEQRDQGTGPDGAQGCHGLPAKGRAAGHAADYAPPDGHIQLRDGPQALEEGLRINRTAFCDAAALAARISGYGLDMAPAHGQDLRGYDELLQGIGQS